MSSCKLWDFLAINGKPASQWAPVRKRARLGAPNPGEKPTWPKVSKEAIAKRRSPRKRRSRSLPPHQAKSSVDGSRPLVRVVRAKRNRSVAGLLPGEPAQFSAERPRPDRKSD